MCQPHIADWYNKYVLLAICPVTKYIVAQVVPRITATVAAQSLWIAFSWSTVARQKFLRTLDPLYRTRGPRDFTTVGYQALAHLRLPFLGLWKGWANFENLRWQLKHHSPTNQGNWDVAVRAVRRVRYEHGQVWAYRSFSSWNSFRSTSREPSGRGLGLRGCRRNRVPCKFYGYRATMATES